MRRRIEEDEGPRPTSRRAADLDLAEAIREEVILVPIALLALCEPDCRGLCPQCGINLNKNSCECSSRGARSPMGCPPSD